MKHICTEFSLGIMVNGKLESYQSFKSLQKKYSQGYFLEIQKPKMGVEQDLSVKFQTITSLPTRESTLFCHLKLHVDLKLSDVFGYCMFLKRLSKIDDFSIVSASLQLFYEHLAKMQDF